MRRKRGGLDRPDSLPFLTRLRNDIAESSDWSGKQSSRPILIKVHVQF